MHTIEVNGVTLHYDVYGEGRPIVLVHGNGEDHHLFDTEIGQLEAAGFQVFAPDSRGHGANTPLSEYHYADMAEDMYQFIQALELQHPVLYGHSDGGIIGLMLAVQHPDTLDALAVSGANLSPEGLDPAFIAWCKRENEAKPDPLFTLMLTEPHMNPGELNRIKIPVLITAGENDLVLREETERIGAAIEKSKVVILKNEDHGSYINGSRIMGELLINFMRGISEDVWTD